METESNRAASRCSVVHAQGRFPSGVCAAAAQVPTTANIAIMDFTVSSSLQVVERETFVSGSVDGQAASVAGVITSVNPAISQYF
jgi:hypothetical protein